MKLTIIIILIAFFGIITISCEKEKEPTQESKIVLSVDSIIFHGSGTKNLFLSVNPPQWCEYQIISKPDWVTVTPMYGTIERSTANILITSQFGNVPANVLTGNLIIKTTIGFDTVFLKGIIAENTSFTIQDSLVFSIFENQKNIRITNTGTINLPYSLSVSNPAITLSATNGQIAFGGYADINVNFNRDNMETGIHDFSLYLNVNEIIDTIPVVVNHFQERKLFLQYDVIDAEYSKPTEKIVFVSSTATKIFTFDTQSNVIESVDLSYLPTCVAVSSNGQTAVVGHDGQISYIDLANKRVIRTYGVSCSAFDIVLGDNQWVYIFPLRDQWEQIRCINLSLNSQNEELQTGGYIRAGTKAKIHPSGKYIYGTHRDIWPIDVEKYNIQNGCAHFMYNSPYHGEYPINGDLWISEDGMRIFTRDGTVFRATENETTDLTYIGNIVLESSITWSYSQIVDLTHSTAKQNIYLVASGEQYYSQNKPFVYIYSSINLNLRQRLDLEKYKVSYNTGGGNLYDASPHFIFCNSSGDKVFVITNTFESALENDWAIQTLQIQ